jgi:hypothetical protein
VALVLLFIELLFPLKRLKKWKWIKDFLLK